MSVEQAGQAGAAGDAQDAAAAAGAGANVCDGVTCQHGGTCVASGASFQCDCPLAYKGKHCETDATQAGDTTPPTIVSIDPPNQATGVKSNAQIKITFSEAMNTASVTNALTVNSLAAADWIATWDGSGEVLTVVPKTGFAYAEGTTPAGTPPVTYTISLGAAAKDLAGNPIEAVSSTFTTLRHISQTIASEAVAEYSDYGHAVGDSPSLCPDADPVAVAHWLTPTISGTTYTFVSFDTAPMGPSTSIQLESADVTALQIAPKGDFYGAHAVVIKHLKYQGMDDTILSAPIADNVGFFTQAALSDPAADVSSQLAVDIATDSRKQLYRLDPTGDADSTQALFSCTGFALKVIFLTP